MEDFAIVPKLADQDHLALGDADIHEPIAEHNFNRKKMLLLEQGIGKLQKTTRQQHEVVSQLESGMKAMISETDLRRAVGLAFQEFEHRLEDAFQDSNRKCLAMFSKRDDVIEVQNLIGKKVNWAEYNTVIKKLSDLRQYIDTMADSVFLGHRDALNSEFAKKADKEVVEKGLKAKADFDEVNEVRARLERLEVLVSHTDIQQTAKLEALREETAEKRRADSEKYTAMIAENTTSVQAIRKEHAAFVERLGGAETELQSLSKSTEKLREVQQTMSSHFEKVITPAITSMQEQLSVMEESAAKMQQELRVLAGDARDFQDASKKKFVQLYEQSSSCTKQLEFLMESTEFIKRRERENKKLHATKFKEHEDEHEKHVQQLAAIERQMKRQERDVRHIENRSARALDNVGGGGTMLALPPSEPAPTDPTEHLASVLAQLTKIADSGPPHEQAGIQWNPQKPPLPFGGDATKRGTDLDFGKLQLPGVTATDVDPIDSARGYPGATLQASVPGRLGLSPRGVPQSARAASKKKR